MNFRSFFGAGALFIMVFIHLVSNKLAIDVPYVVWQFFHLCCGACIVLVLARHIKSASSNLCFTALIAILWEVYEVFAGLGSTLFEAAFDISLGVFGACVVIFYDKQQFWLRFAAKVFLSKQSYRN